MDICVIPCIVTTGQQKGILGHLQLKENDMRVEETKKNQLQAIEKVNILACIEQIDLTVRIRGENWVDDRSQN